MTQSAKKPAWFHLPLSTRRSRGCTLHEVGEAIRRMGLTEGFDVVSEFRTILPENPSCLRKIDWVWLKGKRPVAAFEIEGRNAPKSSLESDIQKLMTLRDTQRFVVTYSLRFKDGDWVELDPDYERLRLTLSREPSIRVVPGETLSAIKKQLNLRRHHADYGLL